MADLKRLVHYNYSFKSRIMSTIIIALVIVGSIGLILALLVYINNRDKKTDAAKKKDAS